MAVDICNESIDIILKSRQFEYEKTLIYTEDNQIKISNHHYYVNIDMEMDLTNPEFLIEYMEEELDEDYEILILSDIDYSDELISRLDFLLDYYKFDFYDKRDKEKLIDLFVSKKARDEKTDGVETASKEILKEIVFEEEENIINKIREIMEEMNKHTIKSFTRSVIFNGNQMRVNLPVHLLKEFWEEPEKFSIEIQPKSQIKEKQKFDLIYIIKKRN